MVEEPCINAGLDVPHCSVELPLGNDAVIMAEAVRRICYTALVAWADFTSEDMKVSLITGGITNVLWKVDPPHESGLQPVLVRAFGKNTDLLIDRRREMQNIIWLGQAGFGAKVLATFTNGRIETFLDMRTLATEDIRKPQCAAGIARKLRKFHQVRTNGFEPEPTLYHTLRDWLGIVRTLEFPDLKKQVAFKAIDVDALERELEDMEVVARSLNSPTVFCHCDLLAGNVMVPRTEAACVDGEVPEVQFIDFEYSSYNPRGFDIGNHFCEYAGPECDYTHYPDGAQAGHFVREYLQAGCSTPVEEGEVARVVAEANMFALLSHLYWGLWALVQACYSPIDFDYLSYHSMRMAEYHRRKPGFLQALAEPGCPAQH